METTVDLTKDFETERAAFVALVHLLAVEPDKDDYAGKLVEIYDGWVKRYGKLMFSARGRGDMVRQVRAEKEVLETKFGVKVKTPRPRERTFWEKLLRIDPNKPRIQ